MLLSFTSAAEGELSKDFRISLNDSKSIYIIPEIRLDFNRFNIKDIDPKDLQVIAIKVIFEF